MKRPDDSPAIARHRAEDAGRLDFAALRREALARVQDLAGKTWTDYNLHDPGVTLVELLCFALTELVYRADAPVAEHLRGADGRIDFARQGLIPAERILPCRASTLADYRALMFDRVPGLADATPSADRRGLWHLKLRLRPGMQAQGATALAAARRAYREQRTLGEDLHDEVIVMREEPCSLQAHVELQGARDPALVLAEIYHRCASHVTAAVPLRSLDELLREGLTPEQVYDGPATHARPAPDPRERLDGRLHVRDLATLLHEIEGVHHVQDLKLAVGDAEPTGRTVDWRGDDWVLALRVPGRGADLKRVRLYRRGSPVPVDERAVLREFESFEALAGAAPLTAAPPALTVRHEPHRPWPERHYSVQHHLPPAYGQGDFGVPASAAIASRARIAQLKTYLALFDQVLANGGEQLRHMRDLFAPEAANDPSYWWQVLDDAIVPGIEALYPAGRGPSALQGEIFARRDAAADRRQRALDLMLALYGQTYAQTTMRQFLGYLDAKDLESHLLHNKREFLRLATDFGADRGGGFDYAGALIGQDANLCGLHRLVAVLLGFAPAAGRLLCEPLRRNGRAVVDDVPPWPGMPRRLEALEGAVLETLRPLAPPAAMRTREEVRADLALLNLRSAWMPGELFRAGVERQRYRWRPGAAGAAGGAGQLLLGPDARGAWWVLSERANETAAAHCADSLRRWLLQMNHGSEGLHIVEHVLLRPRGDAAGHRALGAGDGWFTLRASVVLPGWTQRTAQASFHQFAEDTVQINAPAHVAASCLWLDHAAMADFEAAWVPWLEALQRYAAAPGPAQARALDAAACAVIRELKRHGALPAGREATVPRPTGRP